jgi:hypothetical protein
MICCDFIDATKKYEQHRHSMLRWCAFVVGVCLSASAVAQAETSADQAQTQSDPEMEARFELLRKTGDHARLTGRYNEAATAYKAALDIHRHPVIRGRLGLMLAKLGHLDKAAEELHEAQERGQGVTAQERREVGAAYDKAKALTTWVTVIISHTGAKITCDGEPWNPDGHSFFWRFAMPGEHTLRATLDGYEEAVQTFTAKPGDEITLSLTLVPRAIPKLPELPAPIATNPHKTRTFPPWLRSSNVWGAPDYSAKEDPTYGEPKETKPVPKKDGPRFSVNGGVVTVFGVASWSPAVGAVVGVGVRPKEFLSFGLEARAAWLTTPVAGREAISAMTAGGLLSVCGHLKWFLGCGLGYVGTVNISASKVTYQEKTHSFAQPGFGARLGAEIPMGSSFVARASVDALRLYYRVQIGVGGVVIVDQAPVMLGGQLTGEWKF